MAGKTKKADDGGKEGRKMIRAKLLSVLGDNLHDNYMKSLVEASANTEPDTLPKGSIKLLASRIGWDANEISRVARGIYGLTEGVRKRLTV